MYTYLNEKPSVTRLCCAIPTNENKSRNKHVSTVLFHLMKKKSNNKYVYNRKLT
jgi:hypothetical protein